MNKVRKIYNNKTWLWYVLYMFTVFEDLLVREKYCSIVEIEMSGQISMTTFKQSKVGTLKILI